MNERFSQTQITASKLLHLIPSIVCTHSEISRANSTLKNLKTFLRSTMGQERLSSLALMHIHYHKSVDLDNVVDKFKLKSNRELLCNFYHSSFFSHCFSN